MFWHFICEFMTINFTIHVTFIRFPSPFDIKYNSMFWQQLDTPRYFEFRCLTNIKHQRQVITGSLRYSYLILKVTKWSNLFQGQHVSTKCIPGRQKSQSLLLHSRIRSSIGWLPSLFWYNWYQFVNIFTGMHEGSMVGYLQCQVHITSLNSSFIPKVS